MVIPSLKACFCARTEGREITQKAKWPTIELSQLAVVIINCGLNVEPSNECIENKKFNCT